MQLGSIFMCYDPQAGGAVTLDVVIHIARLSHEHKATFHKVLQTNAEMCELEKEIFYDWPDQINEISYPLWKYWNHENLSTIEDRVIL